MYILLLSLAWTSWRQKTWQFFLVAIPPLLNTAVLVVALMLQAVRFVYPVYLVAMLFAVPMLFMPKPVNMDFDQAGK